VGHRTGLDDVEKRKFLTLPGLELRPLCCPARSQSLYRLSYPGSLAVEGRFEKKIMSLSMHTAVLKFSEKAHMILNFKEYLIGAAIYRNVMKF
jgi:hypothetical protein